MRSGRRGGVGSIVQKASRDLGGEGVERRNIEAMKEASRHNFAKVAKKRSARLEGGKHSGKEFVLLGVKTSGQKGSNEKSFVIHRVVREDREAHGHAINIRPLSKPRKDGTSLRIIQGLRGLTMDKTPVLKGRSGWRRRATSAMEGGLRRKKAETIAVGGIPGRIGMGRRRRRGGRRVGRRGRRSR